MENIKIKGLDDLSAYSIEQLNRIENGLNAKASGQLLHAAIEGGKVMGNKHYKNGTGLFGMNEYKKKKAQINGGRAAASLPHFKNMCSIGGKASVKSPKHPNNTLVKCPHCNKESNLAIMKRWHFDKCKLKK